MSLKEFNDKMKYFEESYYEWFYTKTPMGKAQCAIERFLGIETTYDCMLKIIRKRKWEMALARKER